MLYSYNGQEPTVLPHRIILESGESRTSLNELSDSELHSIGFTGPFTKPIVDEDLYKVEWNGSEYAIIELSEEEINRREEYKKTEEYLERMRNIDYSNFLYKFENGMIYKKLRNSALESLSKNLLYTEFMIILENAKPGNADVVKIQKYINILFLVLDFSEEEIAELEVIMKETNLDVRFTIPTEDFISNNFYDEKTNTIIRSKPYESWVLIDGKWEAPIPYPRDKKIYDWNEDLKQWVEMIL